MNDDPTIPSDNPTPAPLDPPIAPAEYPARKDRLLTIGVWFSASLALIMVLGGVFVIPRIYHTDSTATTLSRSDELRACTGQFSAELVAGPTAAALKALAEHGADSHAFHHAVDQADPARYIALTKLARLHPAAFIAECHRSSTHAPFTSCAQARAVGPTPIRRGHDGYNPDLDADHDGIACE